MEFSKIHLNFAKAPRYPILASIGYLAKKAYFLFRATWPFSFLFRFA
ncbi:hypothetical protein [Pollutibacter soli]